MSRIAWALLALALLATGLLWLSPVSDGQSGSKPSETILLDASAEDSIQIKAFKKEGAVVWEIQLGEGSNEPPANTKITGKASTVIDGAMHTGYYRLSTEPTAQLRMRLKSAGKAPSVGKDEYVFVSGHDALKFEFAPTSSFATPWLTGSITNVAATQQVPSEDNGNQHPPIVLTGTIGAPTGGSLAATIGGGSSQLALNVGGNQGLSKLEAGNTHSGMRLEKGSKYSVELKRRKE
jgi:hypothetical protein